MKVKHEFALMALRVGEPRSTQVSQAYYRGPTVTGTALPRHQSLLLKANQGTAHRLRRDMQLLGQFNLRKGTVGFDRTQSDKRSVGDTEGK